MIREVRRKKNKDMTRDAHLSAMSELEVGVLLEHRPDFLLHGIPFLQRPIRQSVQHKAINANQPQSRFKTAIRSVINQESHGINSPRLIRKLPN
jgi:hypothetical protein